jgi:arsenate reductase-like glutaredoxin family protein
VRHIRAEAPGREELATMAAHLPGGADDLLSRRSARFRELGLTGRAFTEPELLELLAAEPRLLRRPIVLAGDRVVVGANRAALAELFAGGP